MSKELNQKLKTEDIIWNLTDLYDSLEDELITDDIDLCHQEAALLQEDFSGRLAELDPSVFARTVKRLERIEVNLGRLATYAFLNFSTQVNNPAAGAFLQKTQEIASEISRQTVFFSLEWSKMEEDSAERLANSEEAADFKHYLEKLRRYADHLLSEDQETVLIEFSPVGKSSWHNLFEKLIGNLKFGTARRTEEEVLSDLYSADRKTRQQAAADLTEGLQGQLHILSHIFNTILADKMINDRLRQYPQWVSSRNLDNELTDSTVTTLIGACTDRYDIVGRYYEIKKDILGLDTLKDYDRYAPLPELPADQVDWQECREMVLSGFDEFSPRLAQIAAMFFDNNWIHAPVMEGKRGGAFAHPAVPDAHPYVLVNYTGNLRDVSTVAHELGHGVHQYLAKEKGYFNSDTPLVLAETASVFAELLIFHKQLEKIEDQEKKKAFICQKLESIFATVFRQISMNRFEDMIHNQRRSEGELSADMLSSLWIKSQKAMFGDSVELTDNYSIWWSYIPHFLHSPGYVYAYAFGELLVLSLYNLYLQEKESFVPKYIELLSQGGSKSPYELMTPFGIDLNDPLFWQGGIQVIEEMLKGIEH
ncbi:MAG: M3 family oligoendopeptidase [Thermodesulfobacteriota bacterium]